MGRPGARVSQWISAAPVPGLLFFLMAATMVRCVFDGGRGGGGGSSRGGNSTHRVGDHRGGSSNGSAGQRWLQGQTRGGAAGSGAACTDNARQKSPSLALADFFQGYWPTFATGAFAALVPLKPSSGCPFIRSFKSSSSRTKCSPVHTCVGAGGGCGCCWPWLLPAVALLLGPAAAARAAAAVPAGRSSAFLLDRASSLEVDWPKLAELPPPPPRHQLHPHQGTARSSLGGEPLLVVPSSDRSWNRITTGRTHKTLKWELCIRE